MSAPLPFEGQPTEAERRHERRMAVLDAQRQDDLVRLHERLDALLFWLVMTVALGAIFMQFGLNP